MLRRKFQGGKHGKAYLFCTTVQKQESPSANGMFHTISKRRYLFRLCHKFDGCLSGFIQVTLIGLPTMALFLIWVWNGNFPLEFFLDYMLFSIFL